MNSRDEILRRVFGSGMSSDKCHNIWYVITGEPNPPDNQFNYKCDENILTIERKRN